MHQEVLDYEKQCKIAFGTYVQAHTEANARTQIIREHWTVFTYVPHRIIKEVMS